MVDPMTLRAQYPVFRFTRSSWQLRPAGLELTFEYQIADAYRFTHRLVFVGIEAAQLERLAAVEFEQYLLAIGMVELYNYWKLTAAPEISIEVGSLTADQQAFWHTLLIHGMGEYFYQNSIDFRPEAFVRWTSAAQASASHTETPVNFATTPPSTPAQHPSSPTQVLVPMGGGKDSALTASMLQHDAQFMATPIVVNQYPATTASIEALGLPAPIAVERHLDPLLLELNREGFLNGHVPFSAVVAFISVFSARLHGKQFVVLSNERSSNEGNVEYLGHTINHQYSKTLEFERIFQEYCSNSFRKRAPRYFSLLRPLYEVQIAEKLAEQPTAEAALKSLVSCNRGQRTGAWCGQCSKCLFSFLCLWPFFDEAALIAAFGADLLADDSLVSIALELVGKTEHKPFECVGTHAESRTLLRHCASAKSTAPLIRAVEGELGGTLDDTLPSPTLTELLESWDDDHLVPPDFLPLLQKDAQ